MKKITLLFILLITFSFNGYAQFPETFEGAIFPPAGWTSFIGTNGLGTTENWKSQVFDTGTAVCVWEVLPAGQTSEDWLVTPQVAITNANNILTFQSVDSGTTDYGSIYTVRVSTNSQTTHSDFTIVDTQTELDITHSQTTMDGSEHTVDLSAYIGQSIYVAFVLEQNDGDLWRIDNVDFTQVVSCPDPNITFDDYTSTTADISTDTVGNFDVEWGVFPYTQGSGGSTATITNSDSYQLTGLMPGVSYNVFVRQDCGVTDGTSNYVEVVVGTSPDFSTLPLAEDFEPDANQALLLNFGLSFNNVTGDWSFGQDDTTDGDLTNDYANGGVSYMFSNSTFTDANADATFFIGPFDLIATNEYTFTFMQRNLEVASATRPNKDIEVVVATTNDGTTNTVIETFDDMDNTTYTQRMVTFTPTVEGSYYFGIRDKSALLTGVTLANVVIIDDLNITSQPLSVNSFESNTFNHFYNAHTKDLTIKSSNLPFKNIELYNTLGQQVLNNPLSKTEETINLSNLSNGIYIVNINIEGNSKTFKLLKY